MNKPIIPIIAVSIITAGIGAFVVFPKLAFPRPQRESQTKTPAAIQSSLTAINKDKWNLWQKPAYFRGAAIHPYSCYGCGEDNLDYATLKDFQNLRKQGANVVSLNYPGPFKVDPPYDIDQQALKFLDDAIDWAEEVGLYVVIHLRNGPGRSEGTFAEKDAEWKTDETLWYSKVEQEKWIEMWRFVAKRYKDSPHVAAYNLMVEPHPDDPFKQRALDASVWNNLAKRITQGIREVDKDTPIIVSAAVWSNAVGFHDLQATKDPKTIYSFHMYEPLQFTHQGFDWAGLGESKALKYPGIIPSDLYEETRYWDKDLIGEFLEPVKKFQKENNAPIFVGEFGCNRRVPSCVNYINDLLEIFNEQGWGYTIYVWHDVPDGFDYEKGVAGSKATENSEYLELFREEWKGNEYFFAHTHSD